MTSLIDNTNATAEALLRPLSGGGMLGAQTWQKRYARLLLVGDALTAAATVALVSLISSDDRLTPVGVAMLLLATPVWLIMLGAGRAYEQACIGLGTEEFRRVGAAGIKMLALIAVVGFGFKLGIPRSLTGVVLPFMVGLSLLQRAIARNYLHRARAHGQAQHGAVIVGTPEAALGLVERLQGDTKGAFRVVNVCASNTLTVDEVLASVRTACADTVVVASSSGLEAAELRRLGWALESVEVDLIVSTDLIEVAGPRIHVRPVGGLPLLHVERPELGGFGKFAKGAFDRTSAFLALLVISPIMLAIAVAVRRTSPGGALFRQTRVGKDGREFTVLKFRTMRQGADAELALLAEHNEHDGPLFKMKNDPRITKVGGKLRRLSLDELPQLWNVVRGDMSLVGPRPPLPTEVAEYESHVHRRLLVKPGLTGLWQVSGRSDLTWEQSVRLDLNYVENWSFAADLAIIFRTVGAVMASRGAY